MVTLNRIYTRTGDGGETRLATGETTPKDDPRVEAYGDVDETNACIGLVRFPPKRMRKRVAGSFHGRKRKDAAGYLFQLGTVFGVQAIGSDGTGYYRNCYRDAVVLQYIGTELLGGDLSSGPLGPTFKTIAVHMRKQQADAIFSSCIRHRHIG